jgi:hypothetical protein
MLLLSELAPTKISRKLCLYLSALRAKGFNDVPTMKVKVKGMLLICLAVIGLLAFTGAGVVDAQVQLNIQPGVQLSWPTPNATNTYLLQWAPRSGGVWSDLVVAVAGNGSTRTNFDPFPSGSRQYQDLVFRAACERGFRDRQRKQRQQLDSGHGRGWPRVWRSHQ